MSMICKVLSANNWWSNYIFYGSSYVISHIESWLLVNWLTIVCFASFWRFVFWWNSSFFIFIQTFENSLNFLIYFVNVINPVFFNGLMIWVIKSRPSSGFLLSWIKNWAFHFSGLRRIFTVEQRLFHFLDSFEKFFFILVCIKFVCRHFAVKWLFLTISAIRNETFGARCRVVKEGLPWICNGFGLFHSCITALSLGNDRNSCFEVSSSIILVFLVVREIVFFDAELSDSFPAIGSIILFLDFFNSLISLRKLNTFLHVLEVVAPAAIIERIIVRGKALPGAGGIVVHCVIIGS